MRSSTVLLSSLLAALSGCGRSAPEPIPEYPQLPTAAEPEANAQPPEAAAAPDRPVQSPAPAARRAPVGVEVPPHIAAIVTAPDRSEADRALDDGRHPGELLAFFGVAPGMKIAELMAGGGYTAELLARAVGPSGTVYGVNSPWVLERFAEKPWSERLKKPVMKNVVRVDREMADPLPPEAKDLDMVIAVLFYHDFFWMEVDRAALNAAVFRALEPGGIYAIVDHSAREGAGADDVKTLHRVEQSIVRDEIERAGFELVAEGDFLRNPGDTRDWNAAPSAAAEHRGTSDRFVLKFIKP